MPSDLDTYHRKARRKEVRVVRRRKLNQLKIVEFSPSITMERGKPNIACRFSILQQRNKLRRSVGRRGLANS